MQVWAPGLSWQPRERKLPQPEILLWTTPVEPPRALQASECHELLDPTRASCVILGFDLPPPGGEALFHDRFSALLEGLPTTLLVNSRAAQGILV